MPSPEGYRKALRLTAGDLKLLGIIEQVITESDTYIEDTMESICDQLD